MKLNKSSVGSSLSSFISQRKVVCFVFWCRKNWQNLALVVILDIKVIEVHPPPPNPCPNTHTHTRCCMVSGRMGDSDNRLEEAAFKHLRMSELRRNQSCDPTFLLTDMLPKAQSLKTCIRWCTKLVPGLGCESKSPGCVWDEVLKD